MNKLILIFLAVLFFGFIILIHELGHFIFAKLFKVKVNEFAIGMGPKLFKFSKGETKYTLRLLPMGGFVSMEGEDNESSDERSFSNLPPIKKAIILSAGALINIIFGIILMSIILSSGLIGTNTIHSFSENAESAKYGLKSGDEIIAINGNRIRTDYDLMFFMGLDKDFVVDFKVKRGNEQVSVKGVNFKNIEIEGRKGINTDFFLKGIKPSFKSVIKYTIMDSYSVVRMVFISLWSLITNNLSVRDLAGPIGTIDIVASSVEKAVQTTNYKGLMTIMALIAINVGVFNLLPIPALDGGRLIFVVLEGIRRKRISPKIETAFHSVGMMLLIGFMIVITINDLIRLFHK